MINSNEIKNKIQNSNSIDKNKQEEEIGNREYQLCIQKALNEALNENELLKEEINKLNNDLLKANKIISNYQNNENKNIDNNKK